MPGVCAGSLCREVYKAFPRAPVLCYGFVLFVLFAAGVHFDISGPVLYLVDDSVRTGLPVLLSSHAGDCGRLLLILL